MAFNQYITNHVIGESSGNPELGGPLGVYVGYRFESHEHAFLFFHVIQGCY